MHRHINPIPPIKICLWVCYIKLKTKAVLLSDLKIFPPFQRKKDPEAGSSRSLCVYTCVCACLYVYLFPKIRQELFHAGFENICPADTAFFRIGINSLNQAVISEPLYASFFLNSGHGLMNMCMCMFMSIFAGRIFFVSLCMLMHMFTLMHTIMNMFMFMMMLMFMFLFMCMCMCNSFAGWNTCFLEVLGSNPERRDFFLRF